MRSPQRPGKLDAGARQVHRVGPQDLRALGRLPAASSASTSWSWRGRATRSGAPTCCSGSDGCWPKSSRSWTRRPSGWPRSIRLRPRDEKALELLASIYAKPELDRRRRHRARRRHLLSGRAAASGGGRRRERHRVAAQGAAGRPGPRRVGASCIERRLLRSASAIRSSTATIASAWRQRPTRRADQLPLQAGPARRRGAGRRAEAQRVYGEIAAAGAAGRPGRREAGRALLSAAGLREAGRAPRKAAGRGRGSSARAA